MHLDLSWSGLTPTLLCMLSNSLIAGLKKDVLRNLSLSHNMLCHDENHQEYESSEMFVQNLIQYLKESRSMTHLDLSAMILTRRQTLAIGNACSLSESLIGVHFSDNGIRYD